MSRRSGLLDELLEKLSCSALLIVARSSRDPFLAPFIGQVRLNESFLVGTFVFHVRAPNQTNFPTVAGGDNGGGGGDNGANGFDIQVGFFTGSADSMSDPAFNFITPTFGNFTIMSLVPEPSTTLLALAGLSAVAALGLSGRRRAGRR